MRQIWIPKAGGPEVLEVREAPDPEPAEGEIRIRTRGSGVNFADIMARMGLYPDAPPFPAVMGYEVSGEVDAKGAGVDAFEIGDKVVAMTRFGGYADTVCVQAEHASAMSERLDFAQAAAIPVNYLTAWLMLVKLGNVEEGERVLVHAAAGGVGQAAVQICRWRGATVVGTASKPKHERLQEMGVEHVIDYRNEDFETEVRRRVGTVDVVIDAVGGDSFKKSYRLLAPMGRMFMFGVSSFAPGRSRSILAALGGLIKMPRFRPVTLMNDNRGVFGVNLGRLWDDGDKLRSMLAAIGERVDAGDFSPVVDKVFDFDEAAAAHAYIQDRKNFGKVVLRP